MKTEAQITLERLNKDFNVSDEKIADKLKVRSISVYRWRTGKTHPSYATLKILERILKGYKATAQKTVQ